MSRSIVGILFAIAALTLQLNAQVSVLTYHNDNFRSGQNLNEVTLNTASMKGGFGKLFTDAVDDWVVAQPLYVSNLSIHGGTHNVVFVATLNNTLYALDADNPHTVYWKRNFGTPTPFANLCHDSGYQGAAHKGAGIVSTPVIDLKLNTIFFVAKSGTGTLASPYAITFYAVDLANGLTIASSLVNPGASDYNPYVQMSRPGLAEDPTGTYVYVALGTTGCKEIKYAHGYVLAYSTTTAQQVASFATTVGTRNDGGIWQGGGGLAVDASGDIFFETADGYFDDKINFGDSIVQLSGAKNGLSLLDWFTPDNQNYLSTADLDLASVGPVLLPDQLVGPTHLLIGSGKAEEIYVVNSEAGKMGKFDKLTNRIVQDIDATASMSGCINVTVAGSLGNTCRSGSAAYFVNISTGDGFVYFGDNGTSSPPSNLFSCDMVQYTLSSGKLSTAPTASTRFSTNCSVGSPSISADGPANGLVWVVEAKGLASALYAIDASTLSHIYSSQTDATRDSLGNVARFVTPTVVNGKVYVGGRTGTGGTLVVYGLLN